MKTRHRLLWLILTILLPITGPARTLHAQQRQGAHPEKAVAARPITLDLYNVSLAEALTACCQQAGCHYRFSDAIKAFVAREHRTVHVQAIPFQRVFDSLLEPGTDFAMTYSYRQVGNVFLIEGPTAYADLKQAPPVEVFAALLESTGANYAFPTEAIHGSPMDFRVDLPLEQALAKFFACVSLSHPLKYTTTTGVIVFYNEKGVQRRQAIPQNVDPLQDPPQERVTIRFKNIECLAALRALFQVYQKNFIINVPVTSKVSLEMSAPFRIILDKILRSENADLTYMVNQGMFTIVKRSPPGPE